MAVQVEEDVPEFMIKVETLVEYRRLSLQEKAERFPFEGFTDDKAFITLWIIWWRVGAVWDLGKAYDEFAEISECWDNMQEEKLVEREVEKSMYLWDEMGMIPELFQ